MQANIVEEIAKYVRETDSRSYGEILKAMLKFLFTWKTGFEHADNIYWSNIDRLFQQPFGLHFTPENELYNIVHKGEGLLTSKSRDGRVYFVTFVPSREKPRSPFNTNEESYRDVHFMKWLSYFAMEKIDRDGSVPSILLVDLDGLPIKRHERHDERLLKHVQRVYTETDVEAGRVVTYAKLDQDEYSSLLNSYGPLERIKVEQFLAGNVQPNIADEVGARLFRKVYIGATRGSFANLNNYIEFARRSKS